MKLEELRGLGPKKKALLHDLGIFNLQDLLLYFPRSFEDRRQALRPEAGSVGHVEGRMLRKRLYHPPGKKQVLTVSFQGADFAFDVIFFQSSWLERVFEFQKDYIFYGQLERKGSRWQMVHPAFSAAENRDEFLGIIPIYSVKKGIGSKDIAAFVEQALPYAQDDFFLEEDLREWQLMAWQETLQQMHKPTDRLHYGRAKYRVIFEEFFRYLLMNRAQRRANHLPYTELKNHRSDFLAALPFSLTKGQLAVMDQLDEDLSSTFSMQRLLQADVGSGKSVLGWYGLYQAVMHGNQGAYLAPTEILAKQQFDKLQELYGEKIRMELLTSSTKNKRKIYKELSDGSLQLVVGTHALLQEGVLFRNLDFVVADEQQRFGVRQRQSLLDKSPAAHLLMMSATPIPRTMSMILHQNLQVSNLYDKPPGRGDLRTRLLHENKRFQAYEHIREEMQKGNQAFIVFPLIEESERLQAESMEENVQELSRIFPKDIAFLHGKMSSAEKEKIIGEFERGEKHVLAATSLVEVGIDMPRATVLVLRSATRFGLSQIHQLRGRIGRSHRGGTCYLCYEGEIPERLHILEQEQDGFVIAQKDLELRGPGELAGTAQSGYEQFQVADLFRHSEILERVASIFDDELLARYTHKREEREIGL